MATPVDGPTQWLLAIAERKKQSREFPGAAPRAPEPEHRRYGPAPRVRAGARPGRPGQWQARPARHLMRAKTIGLLAPSVVQRGKEADRDQAGQTMAPAKPEPKPRRLAPDRGFVPTWHSQPFTQGGEPRQIPAIGRTRRGIHHLPNLRKCQPAPKMRNDHLSLLQRQRLKRYPGGF